MENSMLTTLRTPQALSRQMRDVLIRAGLIAVPAQPAAALPAGDADAVVSRRAAQQVEAK
jgi:hypothetical protein